MSEKFIASNRVEVWISDDGSLHIEDQTKPFFRVDKKDQMPALREFFLHERDTELGRWRWPDDPRYLVFALKDDDEVRVLDENSGQSITARRSNLTPGLTHSHFIGAALAYFAAHPESKPWHDAKPGDVWALTYGGQETAHVWTDRWAGQGNAFVSDRAIVEADDPDIKAGRRIWPEVVSDDA